MLIERFFVPCEHLLAYSYVSESICLSTFSYSSCCEVILSVTGCDLFSLTFLLADAGTGMQLWWKTRREDGET